MPLKTFTDCMLPRDYAVGPNDRTVVPGRAEPMSELGGSRDAGVGLTAGLGGWPKGRPRNQ